MTSNASAWNTELGIHASPTCTMRFGDEGGAIGWLVGERWGDALDFGRHNQDHPHLLSGRSGTGQAVINRHAQAFVGDWCNGNGFSAQHVESMQHGEQVGRCFVQVLGWRQIAHDVRFRFTFAEGQVGFAGQGLLCIQPDRSIWRVMTGKLAG